MNLQSLIWQQHGVGEGWEDSEQDVSVWVSVQAFDAAWQLSKDYIGKYGAGSKHPDRYESFGQWLMTSPPRVDMPSVTFDDCGLPEFTDGRHRFAWLRDHGAISLPVEVPPDQVELVTRLYGSAR